VPRQVFDYDPPDRFVAGTVGQPGQRTFFLQATGGGSVTSVALEKEQVQLLAERVDELLDEVLRRTGGTAPVPAVAPVELDDKAPLDQPILEEFRVGTMALAWDGEAERVIVEARAVSDVEISGGPGDPDVEDGADGDAGETDAEDAEDAEDADEDDEDDDPDLDVLRVHITGGVARAFARRALAVVQAGRPPCPFCGQPLDPAGHVCPRQNGYRRR